MAECARLSGAYGEAFQRSRKEIGRLGNFAVVTLEGISISFFGSELGRKTLAQPKG